MNVMGDSDPQSRSVAVEPTDVDRQTDTGVERAETTGEIFCVLPTATRIPKKTMTHSTACPPVRPLSRSLRM